MTQYPNDPTTQIEIGAVRPDELESLLALICEVFQLPYEPARELFYKDPYLNLENKRVLRVNGRIVSCLTIADREVWLGNATVRVGGIAGVATHPDERNKGYAGLLLENTLGFLKTQGYALSALIPYSAHFYRRFGYEICGNAWRGVTAPSYLPYSREIRNVRPARPDDAEQLEQCYSMWARRRTFYGIRDLQRWRYLLQNVSQCYVYVDAKNKITGYVMTELRHNPPAFEGDSPMPTLRVLEMISHSPAARRGIFSHLAQQFSAGMIEFTLPHLSTYEFGSLMGTGIGDEILANVEIVPLLMVRILDFASIINACLPYHGNLSSSLRLEVRDASDLNRTESWTVLHEQDKDTIRKSATTDASLPSLSADLRVWAQVMIGFKAAEDAIAQGLLFASNNMAERLGEELFPISLPFLPIPDHF